MEDVSRHYAAHLADEDSGVKVLYVTANPYLRSTTSSLNAIMRELEPKGLQPIMLFTSSGPWQQSLVDRGIRCHVVPPLFVPDKKAPLSSLWHVGWLSSLIVRERIDIVHCNEHEHYPAVRVAVKATRVKSVVTLHWNLEAGFGSWAFRRPYAPSAIQFLSRAQLDCSRQGLPADLPPDRVKLLMSGLAIDEFIRNKRNGSALRRSWGVAGHTVVIGAACAIMRRKHLEDFIMVISRLRKMGRPVLGVIAGGEPYVDHPYKQELEELISREQLGDHCRWVGNLDPVAPFFDAIDIAVNAAEMEILSMSMCEAMACGVPTVAYAVGGNPETVHDPWCVVPFGDVEALTQRVVRLVDDAAFRTEMGIAAERYVRTHFDAPVLAATQAAIYDEVMGSRLD